VTNFALTYLVQRFFYRIFIFLRNWYVGSARLFFRETMAILEGFDRTIALRATAANFFKPLYQDYSAIGRILGLVFRSGRIVIGAGIYAVVIACAAALFVAWALLPIVIFFF